MDKPAFPVPMIMYSNGDSESVVDYGMTLREHAALTLRVPDSGDERIDAMIRQANRRDAAVAVLNGELASQSAETGEWSEGSLPELTRLCVALADALIAKLEETK